MPPPARTAAALPPTASLRADGLAWLALATAFSPVAIELGLDVVRAPKYGYALLVLGLLAAVLRAGRGAPAAAPRADGALLLGCGLCLELIGILGETALLARLGIPVAALGLARLRGRPSLAALGLVFWLVPVPNSLIELTSPGLERALAAQTAAVLGAAGAPIEAVGISLVSGAHRLDLRAENGGLLLAHLCAALGWFAEVRAGAPWRAAARAALLASLAAAVLQPLGLLGAGALVAAGHEAIARAWLTHGLWIATGAAALLWMRRDRPRAPVGPRRSAAPS